MDRQIERKLREIGRQGDPDRAFVRSLEKRLRQEVGHPVWWIHWSKLAAAGGTALVLATSATGVYAYTSDNVLPDTPLYSVRLGIEKVEETLAVTPKAKAVVVQQIKERRAKEQEILQRRDDLQEQRKRIKEDQTQLREDRQQFQDQKTLTRDQVSQAVQDRVQQIRAVVASDTRMEIKDLPRSTETTETLRTTTGTEKTAFEIREGSGD